MYITLTGYDKLSHFRQIPVNKLRVGLRYFFHAYFKAHVTRAGACRGQHPAILWQLK